MASCLLGRRDGLMFCDHHAAGMDWEGLLGEEGGLSSIGMKMRRGVTVRFEFGLVTVSCDMRRE